MNEITSRGKRSRLLSSYYFENEYDLEKKRSSTQSAKIRLEADCGLDYELLVSKFRLKLKKVGKNH